MAWWTPGSGTTDGFSRAWPTAVIPACSIARQNFGPTPTLPGPTMPLRLPTRVAQSERFSVAERAAARSKMLRRLVGSSRRRFGDLLMTA